MYQTNPQQLNISDIIDIRTSQNPDNDKKYIPKIPKDEVERKIFDHFQFLNDVKALHNCFTSYDFHENEKYMLEYWQEILDFYFDSIFNTFGLRIKDILEYSKFKNRRPLGLPNILLDLRKKNIYITDNDIYSEEYYQNFFPEICEKKFSFFSYLKNGFNGVFNYAYNYAKGIDNDEIKPLDENSILINVNLFMNHCNYDIMNCLYEFNKEQITNDVIIKNDFIDFVKKNNNLRFKDLYSNLCLHFLNKTKRIILFNVKVENRNIECIKIINNINDIITKKDIVRIQIRITLNNISKKIDNIQKEIGKCMLNAKNCLRNKNKQQARTFLLKKKTLEKTLNMYYNQQNTIENQLNDLNSMEDNLKNLNIIQDAIEVGKQIGLKAEDYDEVASDFKEQSDNYNDIHDMIKEMGNNNVNEEDINKELNDLLNENDNNDRGGGQLFDFPDVNNEIPNKKEEEKFENLIN